ncbi:UNVERIFIED_CONTAM: hypothetical protein Sradi_3017600 [Sesamum radiatum]|uniref:Integrase catalytic domain-containing protein n=1 Tax=Sesamum radiatum TaxID=300843 RepID=A0AAW2S1B8_SESRA
MCADVKQFVKECATCHRSKYSLHTPYGLLQPLSLPNQVWEDISMNFITHLPNSIGKAVIWVLVDRLSKFAHFIAVPTHFTAASLVTIFLSDIYWLHGAPRSIVSDRDRVFVSHFWRELFRLLGTALTFNSSYHLQTNGAIGMTPFEALFVGKPPTMARYSLGTSSLSPLMMFSLPERIFYKSSKLIYGMLNSVWSNRRTLSALTENFRKGNGFTSNCNLIAKFQFIFAFWRNLPNDFMGLRILRRIGFVAYELELSPTSRIHPAFHISLLKPYYGAPPDQVSLLVNASLVSLAVPVPVQILDRRVSTSPHSLRREILVQWSGQDAEEAT